MILRIALFVMMAVGLCGLGTVAWIAARPSGEAAAATRVVVPAAPKKILVAAHPLRAGALIKPEDITSKDLVPTDLPEGINLDTPAARSDLVGSMLKRALGKDDPLLTPDMMRPSEHGFLAAVVGQGMRAVTIGVDAISGTAGLISPGDRVDVILTQTLDDPTLPLGRRIAAETVLGDVRVVAIDQQIMQGDTARAPDAQKGHTVTLEVTGQQAERVTVAARIGHLSLSVRSADSTGSTGNNGPVFASDVSRALAGQAARPAGGVLRVYSGTADSKEFRF